MDIKRTINNIKRKNKKHNKAFTLVELVVVIAVVAVLAGVSVAAYYGITDKAQKSNVESLTKQVKDLYTMYRLENEYVNNSYNSLLDYGREFIDEYLPSQGVDNKYVNYTYLEKKNNNDNEQVTYSLSLFANSNSNEESSNSKDLIFFITDKYTSYFIVDGNTTNLIFDTNENNTIYSSIDDTLSSLVDNTTLNNTYSNITLDLDNSLIFGYDENNEYQPKIFYAEYKDKIYTIYNGQSLLEVSNDSSLNSSISSNNGSISINTPSYEYGDIKYDGNQSVNVLPNNADKNNPVKIEIEIPNKGKEQNLTNFEYELANVYFNEQNTNVNFYGNFDEIKSVLELEQNKTKPINLYVGKNAKFNGNYTLEKNVTVYVLGDVNDLGSSVGKGYSDSLFPEEANNNSTLTIQSGSVLHILGNVNVGGSFTVNSGANKPSKFSNIGQIVIEKESTINFASNNNGEIKKFKNYGLIKGEGLLNIQSNGYFRQTLLIYDWLGGAMTSGFADKNIFPFSKYRLNGVDCNLRINAGAQQDFDAFLSVQDNFLTLRMPYVYGSNYTIEIDEPDSFGFEPTIDISWAANLKTGGLFSLSEGYVEYSFDEPDSNLNALNNSVDYGKRTLMYINGVIKDTKIEKVGGGITGTNIGVYLNFDSGFPIYNMGIITFEGSSISLCNNGYKFLPGSYVKTNKSTLTIGTKILFYNRYNMIELMQTQKRKLVFCVWTDDGVPIVNDAWKNCKNISDKVLAAYMDIDEVSNVVVNNGGSYSGCYVGLEPEGISDSVVSFKEIKTGTYYQYPDGGLGSLGQAISDPSKIESMTINISSTKLKID